MQLKTLTLLALTFVAAAAGTSRRNFFKHIMPLKSGHSNNTGHTHTPTKLSCEATPRLGPIKNHGGPIMAGKINLYYIWYGNWSDKKKNILETLGKNIGASSYFNVEKTYGVKGPVVLKSSVTDHYSQGKRLVNDDLVKIISNSMTKLKLPIDTNGIYFILADETVDDIEGFCRHFCGFHTNATIKGKAIKYAFVGTPTNCLGFCSPCNIETSPNNDPVVDSMASTLTHELLEAATNPLGNAWYDAAENENADKCRHTYGSTKKTRTGAYYNLNFGGLNYLIQQNWKAPNGGCAKF